MDKKMIPSLTGLGIAVVTILLTVIFPGGEGDTAAVFSADTAAELLEYQIPVRLEDSLMQHLFAQPEPAKWGRLLYHKAGIREFNGIYLSDDRLIQTVGTVSSNTANHNTKEINLFAQERTQNQRVYVTLVPTAQEVYQDRMPQLGNRMQQLQVINGIYQTPELSRREYDDAFQPIRHATCVDTHTALMANKNLDLYYSTDSGITSSGAYALYNSFMTNIGAVPYSKDLFHVEYAKNNYRGDLYHKALLGPEQGDTISLYRYAASQGELSQSVTKYFGTNAVRETSVFDLDYLDEPESTKVFLGRECGVQTIQTNTVRENLPDSHHRLLIFGDDTVRPMIQFLSLHYDTITVVDFQHLTKQQTALVNPEDYDTVLFLYQIDQYTSDNNISSKLSWFR